jgi:hypothetical protein
MKFLVLCIVSATLVCGCSKQPPTAVTRLSPASSAATNLPPRLDYYFELYCDYTGQLGIGFVPSHTFDYRFRHQLKTTQDPELKRLYVLRHLHEELSGELARFEKGIKWTGLTSSRPLNSEEWQATMERIRQRLDDLAAYVAFTNYASKEFDPVDSLVKGLDSMWVEDLRQSFRSITNAHAVNASQGARP